MYVYIYVYTYSFISCILTRTRLFISTAASKNVPDWTYLLEALALLVSTCRTDSMEIAGVTMPVSLCPPGSGMLPPVLDHFSTLCVTSRTLYSIALRQCRYAKPLISLITHLSYENVAFSGMISELLFEALFQCTAETTGHVFEIMEKFLSIEDSFQSHR
jgi:hypothetical protein